MGKRTPQPPKPVDPTVVSNAQNQANLQSAQQQQRLNMVNTSGPLGASTWGADANAPGGYTQTTTLDPNVQGLIDNLSGKVGGGIDFTGIPGYNYNADFGSIPGYQYGVNPNHEVSDAMYAQATSRLDPQFQQRDNEVRTRLANQGLTPGSAAYDRAMGNFTRERNDAYNIANYSAIGAGETAGLNRAQLANTATGAARGDVLSAQGARNSAVGGARADEINRFGAQGGQLQGLYSLASGIAPGYNVSGVAPTDVMGAYGLQAQQQNNAYQAQVANQQASMQGLYGLGSAAITAWNPLAGAAVKAATKAAA